MQVIQLLILVISGLRATSVTGLNIMYLSHSVKNYLNSNLIIIEELTSRGHSVTLVVSSKLQTIIDVDMKGLEVLRYKEPELEFSARDLESTMINHINKGNRLDEVSFMAALLKNITLLAQNTRQIMWNDVEFIEKLRSKHFDIAYMNSMSFECLYELIPYNMSVPFITETPFTVSWHHRLPNLPSFVPLPIIKASDDMTFWQRLINLIGYIITQFVMGFGDADVELLKTYAPKLKNWSELFRAADLYIIDRDHMLEWPQPSMPNTIFIPGITHSPAEPLPDTLKDIIDSAEKGVIYFSFGSILSGISPSFLQRYIIAFKQLDESYSVIFSFKGNHTKLKDIPKNLHILPWVPQNDILGHSKTKLFINHGGHRGQIEALYHGVPMITTGFQSEQIRNGLRVEKHGYGINLDVYDFTSEELAAAISKILNDPVYEVNVKRASSILKSNPKHAKAVIGDWIEHIAQFGGNHLRPRSMDMSLYEFLMLDILLFLCVVSILLVWLFYRAWLFCAIYLWLLLKALVAKYYKLKKH